MALGLIETKGLIGAIEAADAMVKAADVTIINKEKSTAALITIKIEGEVSAVMAAVDAGAAAAQRVGQLISAHVIPRPDEQVNFIIENTNLVSYPVNFKDLEKMNVSELRKIARTVKDFPIKGRDISNATKELLLEYFASVKK